MLKRFREEAAGFYYVFVWELGTAVVCLLADAVTDLWKGLKSWVKRT
jgi:hypothetical protein